MAWRSPLGGKSAVSRWVRYRGCARRLDYVSRVGGGVAVEGRRSAGSGGGQPVRIGGQDDEVLRGPGEGDVEDAAARGRFRGSINFSPALKSAS